MILFILKIGKYNIHLEIWVYRIRGDIEKELIIKTEMKDMKYD